MKNVALLMIGLLLMIAGTYFLVRPGGVMVVVPEYANAEDKFGYIQNFEKRDSGTTFLFDEATWITGEGSADMPNGFKIENSDAAMVAMRPAMDVVVQLVNLDDQEDGMKEVTIEYLLGPHNENVYKDRPFWISFDEHGLVDGIREQYVP